MVHRVYKYVVKKNEPIYKQLEDTVIKSKALYNKILYQQRQNFFKLYKNANEDERLPIHKCFVLGYDLVGGLTELEEYKRFKGLVQTAQSVVSDVSNDLKSFITNMKEYYNSGCTRGRPKLPNYKKAHCKFTLTNQQVKLVGEVLTFPKIFNGYTLTLPKLKDTCVLNKLAEVRVLPKENHFILEVVLDVAFPLREREFSEHVMGIDLGVDNFATIVTTLNSEKPIIINGKGLKAYNQYFNKQIAKLKSHNKKRYNKYTSKEMQRMYEKRKNKITDFMHKASTFIADYAVENNIGNIVIGYNKGWKQDIDLGKKVNQKFISIPYYKFVQLLRYKCEERGIVLHLTEESYTSGTSFFDNEEPIKENFNKSRRIKRGLFKTNTGVIVNADVNASLQIIKKVFPISYKQDEKGIEVVRFQPKRLTFTNMG